MGESANEASGSLGTLEALQLSNPARTYCVYKCDPGSVNILTISPDCPEAPTYPLQHSIDNILQP